MFKRMMKIALGSEVDKNYIVEENPVATGGPHFGWRVCNTIIYSFNRSIMLKEKQLMRRYPFLCLRRVFLLLKTSLTRMIICIYFVRMLRR